MALLYTQPSEKSCYRMFRINDICIIAKAHDSYRSDHIFAQVELCEAWIIYLSSTSIGIKQLQYSIFKIFLSLIWHQCCCYSTQVRRNFNFLLSHKNIRCPKDGLS